MEIVWYGQTCFRLTERGLAAVITDPYPPEVGITYPRSRAHVITSSYNDPGCRYVQGVRGPFKLFDGPGEYETGGVFITGIHTFADAKEGSLRGRNTVFLIDFDGLTVCHLGHLGHVPTQSQVEDLGTADVLLLPVGGGDSLAPGQASEVISLFEPGIVIPMYYKIPGLHMQLGSLDRFRKEVGLESLETEDTLKISKSSISEETKIIILRPKHREGE
jgi:L-ascorbate metabolism protein UlaG (beta-lactamase superfamily)